MRYIEKIVLYGSLSAKIPKKLITLSLTDSDLILFVQSLVCSWIPTVEEVERTT